ncbi:MAG: HlyD family secretion protein [Lentisphaerae bacterium]|nr:HlyD family secretion protein [Lentisphaerota bacterium]MCP4100007.1 HlyD family secretion protein [Lentisphaerota bacterium]
MTSSNEQQNIKKLQGKLNAVSALLRLGHEAFEQSDLFLTAAHIVNNSRLIIPFQRSAIVDLRSSVQIIAVSGQDTVNQHSEYSLNLLPLAKTFKEIKEPVKLDEEYLQDNSLGSKASESIKYLSDNQTKTVLAVPLLSPGKGTDSITGFIWILEFDNASADTLPLASLLARHYSEAIWFCVRSEQRSLRNFINKVTWKKRIIAAILIAIPLLLLIRIDQNIKADFEIVPETRNSYFAPYSGIIRKCFYHDGNKIPSGATVMEYYTEQMQIRLAKAENNFIRTKAEYDKMQNQAFADKKYLSQLKMLKLAQQQAALDISENKWLLKQSNINARESGILSISDSARLDGNAVQSGEKLFEILSDKRLSAEVLVNERDASVLRGKLPQITLFLHTNPESPMHGTTTSISPKPVLTELKNYCYRIKITLPEKYNSFLRCGMRGVARVSGEKVSLGYYLFRNLVLWWRRI